MVGEDHLRGYDRSSRCEIAAIVDINQRRGEEMAARYGARLYANVGDMLSAERLDALSVCLPHNLHYQVGMSCAESGVHVLMEKPIALTLQEADSLIEEFNRRGLKLSVGFVHRFRPEFQEAARLIRSGALGTLATALDRLCTLGGPYPPPWVWDKEVAGGGILIWTGIHALDRMRWLFDDEVKRVYATTATYAHDVDVEDGVAAILHFRKGGFATISENSPPYGRLGEWRTELFGTHGALEITTGGALDCVSAKTAYSQRFAAPEHFESEIEDFLSSIEENREPAVTGWDGRQALAINLALYESALKGAPVDVPE